MRLRGHLGGSGDASLEGVLHHSQPVGGEHRLVGLLVRFVQLLGWAALVDLQLDLGLDQLAPELVYHLLHLLGRGLYVHLHVVLYRFRAGCELQGRHSLVETCRMAAASYNQRCFEIPSKTFREDPGELAISVWNIVVSICQCMDNIS